jgi:hypothetical protein
MRWMKKICWSPSTTLCHHHPLVGTMLNRYHGAIRSTLRMIPGKQKESFVLKGLSHPPDTAISMLVNQLDSHSDIISMKIGAISQRV